MGNVGLKIAGTTLIGGGVYGLTQTRPYLFEKDGMPYYVPRPVLPIVSSILIGTGTYLMLKKC